MRRTITSFGANWSLARLLAAGALIASAPLMVSIYLENSSLGYVPETRSAAMTAHSLAREGNAGVREYFPRKRPGEAFSYAYRWKGEQLYSIEPLASSLTFAPFFLRYRHVPPRKLGVRTALNAVAAKVAAIALVVLGIWLLTVASAGRALAVTAVIGFATCYRTIVGASLWQHTSATPWLVLGLLAWTHARQKPVLFPLAGVCLAVATACRPILVPPALFVIVDAWLAAGTRRVVTWLTGGLVAAIGLLALFVNWKLHGSLLGGRAAIVDHISETHAVQSYFHFSIFNLAGLLAAPSRGLFVYSPVLLFAIPGLVRSLRGAIELPCAASLRAMTVSGLAIVGLYGFIATWWGGWVFGTRYMADVLPFFALWLALTPLPERHRLLAGALFTIVLVWSLAVQQLGVMTYPCGWNQTPESIDLTPERLWRLHDTELARCFSRLLEARAR